MWASRCPFLDLEFLICTMGIPFCAVLTSQGGYGDYLGHERKRAL